MVIGEKSWLHWKNLTATLNSLELFHLTFTATSSCQTRGPHCKKSSYLRYTRNFLSQLQRLFQQFYLWATIFAMIFFRILCSSVCSGLRALMSQCVASCSLFILLSGRVILLIFVGAPISLTQKCIITFPLEHAFISH